ncbi:hypothetical protein B0T21DRAFT_353672 [Apiosordaria backusii]|uniref:Rad50/SbcC-type AAA domain-containing protein n=1 Tax=Apiosordaria backusii TaxID=314023 RepID=A0AA39ZPX3_9PEZI|nr:hypothetical protein B0T21DRAFT_353672 [Apiosordaria backusii]
MLAHLPTSHAGKAPAPTETSSTSTQADASTATSGSAIPQADDESQPTLDNNESPQPNHTAAIVGGVIGSIALLCLSGIAIVWLLKRNRNNSDAAKPDNVPVLAPLEQHAADNKEAAWTHYNSAGWGPQELPAYHDGVQERAPVELPTVMAHNRSVYFLQPSTFWFYFQPPLVMRGPSAGTVRWLLLSDLHFKHHDLDRIRQTAQWIVAEAERNQVGRAVVCGDLLTSRTMQPTHVLSACYRFISLLIDVVPQVHIVLGNHDLAYRRDYQTTALDALSIKRLAPYVSLHSAVSHHEWDGRHVLLLPFREEQNELTEAVAALDPNEASKTVAFAHLAINKAITQRYVVSADVDNPRATKSITHSGFTGPDQFASLARTFTGHFHSHQTITTQERCGSNKINLQGSVTYLGSPLQLNWADLYDEQRGVVLFDPETLKHELLVNPHAVAYTTADVQQVLGGQVKEGSVRDKHVMLLGKLTHLKYVTARDKLLSLGVRSVRNWAPMGFASSLHTSPSLFGGLGASVPASDAAVQRLEEPTKYETTATNGAFGSGPGVEPLAERLDLAVAAREYVESLDLDESLLLRRDELVRVGQRMIQASREIAGRDDEVKLNHQDFLDKSSQAVGTATTTELAGSSTDVFLAEPRTLTITNFLGVQNTITIDFRQNLPQGLIFLVGENGSGKSTLLEAMVWCQFGRCIRGGLGVNDVVNDNVGKNCSVKLEFANGYAIERYRKHKVHGSRIIVSLHGEPQPQLEHPDARTTQAAINELLGTDYETYVRTVVLSHESAASFLNSTPMQRRDLIESSLGLSMLDQCGQVLRLLLRDIDTDVNEVEDKVEGLVRTMEYSELRLKDLDRTRKRLKDEAEEAVASLEAAIQDHAATEAQIKRQGPHNKECIQAGNEHPECGLDIADHDQQILAANEGAHAPELSMDFRVEISRLQNQIHIEQENLQRLKSSCVQMQGQKDAEAMQEQKHAESMSWLSRLQQQIHQKLESMAAARPIGLRKLLCAMETSILCFLSMGFRGFLSIMGIPKDSSPRVSTQNHNYDAAINSLRQGIEKSTSRLQSLKHEEELAITHALKVSEQLAQAIRAQKRREALQRQVMIERKAREALQRQVMIERKAREALQQQVTIKQREAATYERLVEAEQSSLDSLRLEHNALATKLQELVTNRELFVFWSSALAKRTTRTSSSSSPKSTAKTTPNFREHILVNSLPELNALLAQVLAVLYDDTRHMHTAKGMLRSLLNTESADTIGVNTSSLGSVLDRTLSVHPSFAYGKRSSGERKRVDLALFFALLQLARARSAHRAHYVLVDEVFDNLDEAGQAAVVRWCSVMSQTVVGWIVVITHSRFLAERDPGEDLYILSVSHTALTGYTASNRRLSYKLTSSTWEFWPKYIDITYNKSNSIKIFKEYKRKTDLENLKKESSYNIEKILKIVLYNILNGNRNIINNIYNIKSLNKGLEISIEIKRFKYFLLIIKKVI